MSEHPGIYAYKAGVKLVLERLMQVEGVEQHYLDHQMTLEQAVNAIGRLMHPPENVYELALTVGCPYCGYTPGNPCHRGPEVVKPHPSRISSALGAQA